MSDHNDDSHGRDVEGIERVTSPMQEFSMREAGIGFVVLAIGLAVAYALPLLAA
ncbi:DUF7550 family protein [Halorussus amylolyticus]|uniref:DUF7550 family protein n=1 Tax=Halorussus amylolyticus TaxID=1126242 RepID=UPI00192FAB14|nr:hypothetical protein [Halorussus amylolyticus]